ncbi:MAG: GtrA family protein [Xanthobacteraceae bacterium]|nr:GtrA family protein [Xanthobacteraceae bacterium]
MARTSHNQRLLRPLIDAARTRFEFMRKASTFALVGVVNTAVDFCVFMVGYKLMHLPLIPANLLSWMVAVSGSYVLNSMITFAAESGRRLTLRAYASFVASGIAGFIGNTATLWVASFFVPVAIAKVIAIGASFVLNFSLSHFVVFRRRTTDDGGQRAEDTGAALP